MDGWIVPAIMVCVSYLLGSIPFGVIITRAAGAADPRTIGSGNIGATNVLRTGRSGLAALTLLLDGGKGVAAIILVRAVAPGLEPLSAAGVFLGHLFPVWLRFRGGKGVATLLGLALALYWPCGVAGLAVWLLATIVSRYSSVGGMAAAVTIPVAAAFFFQADLTLLFLALALLVLWKHGGNIARLLEGTEPRIGRSR